MDPDSRALFVAWQCQTDRAIYPVARLVVRPDAPRYEFVYVRGVEDARTQGFLPFARMGALDRVYLSDKLFPLLTSRIMSPSRPDYREHLERLGLEGNPEPIVLLARTAGRRVTDNLEVFAPPDFDPVRSRWVYTAFARGVRYIEGAEQAVAALLPGDGLVLERDPTNPWDARAMLLRRGDRARVGFVPHTLIEDLDRLLDLGAEVSAEVVRVNAPPAPVHQRLLVRILAEHKKDFRPLATRRYQPIPAGATQVRVEPVLGSR